MRRHNPSISTILLLMMLVACSEVINLRTEVEREKLVIYGRITDGTAGNEVNLALTSPYNGNQEPVSEAFIALYEDGSQIARYIEYAPGQYRLLYPGDSAREGRSYELLVRLEDGTEYRSKPTVMPKAAARDELSFDASIREVEVNQEGLEVEKRIVALYADTHMLNPEEDTYLRWNILESYSVAERLRPTPVPPPPCYVSNDATGQQVRLFNGSEVKVPVIPHQLLHMTEIDSRFAFQFFFRVVLTTMDEEAYDYWSLLNEISNTRGSIFDRPAAPVPGNFTRTDAPEEEVLGYFEVVRSDTSFLGIKQEELRMLIFHPCPHSEAFREPAWCTNCRLLENSTIDRPYYWDD